MERLNRQLSIYGTIAVICYCGPMCAPLFLPYDSDKEDIVQYLHYPMWFPYAIDSDAAFYFTCLLEIVIILPIYLLTAVTIIQAAYIWMVYRLHMTSMLTVLSEVRTVVTITLASEDGGDTSTAETDHYYGRYHRSAVVSGQRRRMIKSEDDQLSENLREITEHHKWILV